MKKSILVLLFFLSLVIVSCQKRQPLCCVLPKPIYVISAQKNGVNWNAASQIAYYKTPTSTDTLNLIGHVGEENINFILKKTAENSYTLIDATYFTTVGQDAVVTSFSLDKSQNNAFTVTVSTDEKTFEGTFSVHFKQTYGNTSSPGYPAALDFKDGVYKAIWSSK